MKTITILAAALLILSCSDDDSASQAACDCNKTTYNYVERPAELGGGFEYDPIATEFYSNDCSDDQDIISTDENGTHYRINCTASE